MAHSAGKVAGTSSHFRPGVVAVAAVASLIFLAQVIYLWSFAIDDVGISYRYAEHLAQGQGLVWNPGDKPVEGYSNLLWVLILALGRFIGFDIVVTSKALGVLLGLVSLSGITVLSSRVWGKRSFWWMPAMLVAVTPEWTAWAMSGLEIAFYGTLLILGLLALNPTGRTTTSLLTIAVCGLALTRPEGAGIGLLLIMAALLTSPRPTGARATASSIAVLLAAPALVSIGVIGFRLWYYGHALPNTVYAKFDLAMPSAVRVLMWALFCLPFLAGLAWAWSRIESRFQRGFLISCVGLVVAQMLVVLPVSPVMYFLHRYQIAFLPLVVFAVPLILAKVAGWRRSATAWVALALLLWSVQGWPAVVKRYDFEKYILRQQACVVERLRSLPGRPTIALQDAGRIPYHTDLPAIDAWGLCDEEIARKGFSPYIVLDRRPEVYVFSLDVMREQQSGKLKMRPHLGMDIMTAKVPLFQQSYGLWKLCSPGLTPETADSTSLYYDYGIFLNADWAGKHGMADKIDFVTWPY